MVESVRSMKVKKLIKKHFESGAAGHTYPEDCLQELLEYRAMETDNELNRQLLKELILKYSAAERELVRLNEELLDKQERLNQDLKAAAGIQRTLLPRKLPATNHLQVAWKFIPCEQIGGDIFNIFPLDDDHIAMYMIDVSGHGVPAALITVSVSQALHPDGGHVMKKAGTSHIFSPKNVLATLDEQYPLERFDMFFTMTYGVVNTRDGYFTHGNAGHPPAVLLRHAGDIEILEAEGPIIGMGGLTFGEERKSIYRGDKVIFYTDGIIEYENAAGEFYGKERFYELLQKTRQLPIDMIMEEIMGSLHDFGQKAPPQDDISLLGFEFLGS